MLETAQVRALSTPREIESSFAVMKQLRPHLEAETYVPTIERQMKAGYRLAAVVVGERVEAVAGYRFGESLSWRAFMYVDDLVTSETARSRGHGKLLLDWLMAEAREHGCGELHLDSGVQRFGAHRFYLRERMDIIAHHFRIALD
jgi:GNAT superfamily N-acetyltransferase